MVDVIESLRRHVGHTSFRPGQEALVRAVLDGRDVLAVMPTGSGKSLGALCGPRREFCTRCGPHSGPRRAERAER